MNTLNRFLLLLFFFVFSFSTNVFAQSCNIEITITGRTSNWADKVFLQLIDGSGNTVLKSGSYGRGAFTKVYNYNGINPPYRFKIDIVGDVYNDNAIDFSIKVAGVQDRRGTLSSLKIGNTTYPTNFNEPLINSFTGCSNGGATPCTEATSWIFRTQQDLNDFKRAFGHCSNLVLNDVYIGENYDNTNFVLSNAHTSNITDISALYNVTRITGKLQIANNLNLTNINGLLNLEEIGGNLLEIKRNPNLSHCNNNGIKNYLKKNAATFPRTISGNKDNCVDETAAKNESNNTCPSGSYAFSTQEQINNFGSLFGNCDNQFIGNLVIQGASIVDLRPLIKIKSISGNLIIQNNPLLENLDGLENLNTVNGYIDVSNNAKLKNVSALKNIEVEGIETAEKGIVVQNNLLLSACDLPNFCVYLSNSSNPRAISGNAAECLNEQAFRSSCATLPLNLVSYNVKVAEKGVLIDWATSAEFDSKGFNIFRGDKDGVFSKIASINAGVGKYRYVDIHPLVGHNYYKLVQIDNNGTETILGVREVQYGFLNGYVAVYPNPASNEVNVIFKANVYRMLEIIDGNGKVVQTLNIDKADERKKVLMQNFANGIYLFRLKGDYAMETLKVLKH